MSFCKEFILYCMSLRGIFLLLPMGHFLHKLGHVLHKLGNVSQLSHASLVAGYPYIGELTTRRSCSRKECMFKVVMQPRHKAHAPQSAFISATQMLRSLSSRSLNAKTDFVCRISSFRQTSSLGHITTSNMCYFLLPKRCVVAVCPAVIIGVLFNNKKVTKM